MSIFNPFVLLSSLCPHTLRLRKLLLTLLLPRILGKEGRLPTDSIIYPKSYFLLKILCSFSSETKWRVSMICLTASSSEPAQTEDSGRLETDTDGEWVALKGPSGIM